MSQDKQSFIVENSSAIRSVILSIATLEILKVGRKDFKNNSLECIVDNSKGIAFLNIYSKNNLGFNQVELSLNIDLMDYLTQAETYELNGDESLTETLMIYLNNTGVLNRINSCVLIYIKNKLDIDAENIQNKIKETQMLISKSLTKDIK